MKKEKNDMPYTLETNCAQPLEDAQVEQAVGGTGEIHMSEFNNWLGNDCPRGVTKKSFPMEDICACDKEGAQHTCDYLRINDKYRFYCEKFHYKGN